MKFTNPLFNDLLTYWKTRCRDDDIPTVSHFDLIEIPTILPEITYWEIERDGRIICKMTGTSVVERMGTDITGMYLADIMPPDASSLISNVFQKMQSHPCGLWAKSKNNHPSDRIVRVESFTLPLGANEGALPKYISVNHELETVGYGTQESTNRILLGQSIEKVEFVDIGWGTPDTDEPDICKTN